MNVHIKQVKDQRQESKGTFARKSSMFILYYALCSNQARLTETDKLQAWSQKRLVNIKLLDLWCSSQNDTDIFWEKST